MLRDETTQSPTLSMIGASARHRPGVDLLAEVAGVLSSPRASRLSRQSAASNGRSSALKNQHTTVEQAIQAATVKKAKYLGAAAQEAAKRTIKEEVAPDPEPAVLKAAAAYDQAQSQAHAVYLRKLEEQPDLAKAARRD